VHGNGPGDADARGALRAEQDFRQALAMVTTLAASPERDGRELALVAVLPWLLVRTKGVLRLGNYRGN